MADQNLAAYARSFDINISFLNLCDLVSTNTTPNVVMAGTNASSPVVMSFVSTSITKEGCGKAHIGEGVNQPKDMVDSSNASTDSMGPVNVEQTCATSGLNGSAIKNGSEKVANVPNDADYDVWLPLDTVHEVNDRMKNSLYMHFVGKRLAFPVVKWFVRNNWEKYGLKKVTFMKGNGYTKETIHVEYEWKPPRCSTCLIFGHSFDDCPKSPKRVVNKMDKGKGGSFGVDDKIRWIKYRPKAKQSTEGANQKMTPSISKKKVSIS
ncbi:zinc finger, CCHC-type containing protein, partial [Tanacetum coccineum]